MKESAILLEKSKCRACYNCIRACPVKAIHVQKNSIIPIIEDSKCISCGTCEKSCAYGAISYYNSKKEVIELLNAKEKVVAICAPSIAGEFDDITDYRKFVQMIRQLGFSYVMEMSFGVDIIAERFKRLVENEFKGKYYITSCCPSVVSFVEKSHPELLGNLVPFVSPAATGAVVARKTYGENLKVVHITPCVAAKADVNRYNGTAKIDGVLTFRELRQLFDEFKIDETFTEYSDFDPPFGYKGRMYPLSKGFLEAAGLRQSILKENTATVEGKKNIIDAINQFIKYNKTIKHHFNLFFCEGCVMGPGNSDSSKKYLKHALVKDYANRRLANFNIEQWKKDLAAHADHKEYDVVFSNKQEPLPIPSEMEMKIAFDYILGRNNNIEVDCGACGFDTCKGLAKAIARGIALPELCVTYSQIGNREASSSKEKMTEELSLLKSELKITKESLYDTKEQLLSKNDSLTILIKSLNAGVVLVDENMRIVESNMNFIDTLGDEAKEIHEVIPYLIDADLRTLLPSSLITQFSFLFDHNETKINRDVEMEGRLINVSIFQLVPKKLVGAVFRNLHSEEERPEEIIHRVTEVIEENLRQVQQIGFILGEGAAKTEKMLRSIIKSYK